MTKQEFADAYQQIVSAVELRLWSKTHRIDPEERDEAVALIYERVVIDDCPLKTACSRSVYDALRQSTRHNPDATRERGGTRFVRQADYERWETLAAAKQLVAG